MTRTLSVAVLAGDGIGPEIIPPTLDILDRAARLAGAPSLEWHHVDAGAAHYARTGESLPVAGMDIARGADAILLAAMGLPSVRYPDGTEIAPQLELREAFDLYAGVRPIRTVPGVPLPLADSRGASLDAVLIRESTEGLFYCRGRTKIAEDDSFASDEMRLTRHTSERLFAFAFDLARQRKAAGKPGRVTLIDKANVIGSFAWLRRIFLETAERYPDIETECAYVDAMALNLVRRPWDYDVMVTENMFGDILSDLGAALMGGLGMAPSADIGDSHAVFQPCHGSAPDIAGEGKANPTAMILSGAMMLEWLGHRHDAPTAVDAARMVEHAVSAAFADGALLPGEFGGSAGTAAVGQAVLERLG
ncbi:3-isopropylmalate dehydrogenase [Tsuneonella dongtanensis]|uniref:3-isopropylmalate dehydrogenase n=1 Tax=Tsuneonella dongtanensis TaxID=692370 RepID=A0A1B2AAX8_9SPHN|nr:isocitrate/isopropylmalate dehydrogenase family protein [Tsuneonella dongtanensis]ANY19320.1 3-isopropylmalate dehydrogenase [Tsuneonella dongtanensis]